VRFKFDKAKSELVRKKRGLGFEEVKELFYGPHCVNYRSDDPEQFIAIGWAKSNLYSVIFEVRTDVDGEYYHIVTLWKSTAAERKIYEKEQ
jgi:uncharacterized DUF497 family protein